MFRAMMRICALSTGSLVRVCFRVCQLDARYMVRIEVHPHVSPSHRHSFRSFCLFSSVFHRKAHKIEFAQHQTRVRCTAS